MWIIVPRKTENWASGFSSNGLERGIPGEDDRSNRIQHSPGESPNLGLHIINKQNVWTPPLLECLTDTDRVYFVSYMSLSRLAIY